MRVRHILSGKGFAAVFTCLAFCVGLLLLSVILAATAAPASALSLTLTETVTATMTPTETATPTPALSPAPMETATPTSTPSFDPTPTPTLAPTLPPTPTETAMPTLTPTGTATPTLTATPSATPTPSPTLTAQATPTPNEIRLAVENNGCLAELGEDQILVISLESNPSTGYSWEVAEINEDVLHQVGKTEFEQLSPLLGAPEKQILRFKPVGAGQSTLKLVYHRSWEKGAKPAREFSIQVAGLPSTIPTPEKGLTKPAVEEFTHLELSQPRAPVDPKASGEVELQESLAGWTNIMTEDFEGGFPGSWDAYDDVAGYGEYYWGRRSCRPHSGSYSGWGVGGGASGGSLSCSAYYPDYAESWMVYGPFDLSDATDAELLFWYWNYSEYYFDKLFWGASINGSYFYGSSDSGDSGGWNYVNFDLTNVYTLGDLTGQPQVWIAFVFVSDYSVTYSEGAYVDDIVLHKLTGPTPTPGPPSSLPAAFDWRGQGGVTSVKNQGSCGSCWAFGTVGPLEANIKIKDGVEKDLSEQYLLSCNTDGWDCGGGWWAHDYHEWKIPSGEPDAGAVYENDFPYTARDDSCNPPHTHHEKIDSWTYIGSQWGVPSTEAIKQAIYDYGPVSVAVCVNSAFQSYSGGVFQGPNCTDINHAVVLVGWDDNQGANGVWILKNSWGTGWGESGYMRIGYGVSRVGYSANYVTYGPACVLFGDVNGDGVIGVQDIQEVASRWRMTDADPNWDPGYDLDDDGNINVVDIMKVSAHWGDSCD